MSKCKSHNTYLIYRKNKITQISDLLEQFIDAFQWSRYLARYSIYRYKIRWKSFNIQHSLVIRGGQPCRGTLLPIHHLLCLLFNEAKLTLETAFLLHNFGNELILTACDLFIFYVVKVSGLVLHHYVTGSQCHASINKIVWSFIVMLLKKRNKNIKTQITQ